VHIIEFDLPEATLRVDIMTPNTYRLVQNLRKSPYLFLHLSMETVVLFDLRNVPLVAANSK